MAKTEKIRNTQVVDNKEDKFFYFPMVSMSCTGSGYHLGSQVSIVRYLAFFSPDISPGISPRPRKIHTSVGGWQCQDEETNRPFLDFMAGQLRKSLALEIERFKVSRKRGFRLLF